MGQQLTASVSYPLDQYRFPIAMLATVYRVQICRELSGHVLLCVHVCVQKDRERERNRDK